MKLLPMADTGTPKKKGPHVLRKERTHRKIESALDQGDLTMGDMEELAGLSETAVRGHLKTIQHHVCGWKGKNGRWVAVYRKGIGEYKSKPLGNPPITSLVIDTGLQLHDFWIERKAA